MIQMWSWASTETPIVWPRIQWFGNGFGQSGSTSNLGAMTVAASTAAFFSSTVVPAPRAVKSARKIAPTQRLRFMLFLLFDSSFIDYPITQWIVMYDGESGGV